MFMRMMPKKNKIMGIKATKKDDFVQQQKKQTFKNWQQDDNGIK